MIPDDPGPLNTALDITSLLGWRPTEGEDYPPPFARRAAIRAVVAGIELGQQEKALVMWLSQQPAETVVILCWLLARVRAKGRAEELAAAIERVQAKVTKITGQWEGQTDLQRPSAEVRQAWQDGMLDAVDLAQGFDDNPG